MHDAVKTCGRMAAPRAHKADAPVSTTSGPKSSKTVLERDCHVGGTSQSSIRGDFPV
jgi:hypothetical protein